MFDLEKIKDKCPATLVEFHQQLASTNDLAISCMRNGDTVPLLVLCENQTDGRGQRGKTWSSGEGSLTMSWCFYSENRHVKQLKSSLPLRAGYVVAKAIEHLCPTAELMLKWPNDILCLGRNGKPKKLAGILVESFPVGEFEPVIIGIGVNVNNCTEFGEALTSSGSFEPTSLANLVGCNVDLTSLVIEILQRLESEFLNDSPTDGWREGYLGRLAFRGETVEVLNSIGEVEFEAVLDSVASDGSLVLQMPDGPRPIYSGTIRPL